MNQTLQTLITFAIVLGAATYLLLRWKARRDSHSGCGGECGCPSSEIRAKVRR
jgi:hypothetical protein